MVAQSAVMTPPASGPAACQTMRCDQAIFTSARTSTGQGYRIIAASAGLTPDEKTEISTRSPSHGGLCSEEADARAESFYAIKSGRLCAALSCAAGSEQTGRGGLRIYTRALVFDADALASFGQDSFNVLRSMELEGLGRPELNPPSALPVLALPALTHRAEDSGVAIAKVGWRWLAYLLRNAMTNRSAVLTGEGELGGTIETVLLAVPAPWRKKVSFSRGLKFSIGRPFTLSEVSGDTAAIERVIKGHAIALVHPFAGAAPPTAELGEWEQMAADFWSEGAYQELEAFSAQGFSDCWRESLDRIAALRNAIRRASHAEAGELLALADRRLSQIDGGVIETRLLAELLGTIRERLEDIWSRAEEPALIADWRVIRGIMRGSRAAAHHAAPLAGMILRRLAEYAPSAALEYSMNVAHGPASIISAGDLRALVDAMDRWAAAAPQPQLQSALEKLKRWGQAFPHIAETPAVLARLSERLIAS